MNGRFRTAAKDHECFLCRGKIPTGSRYWDERIGPPDHWENDYWFVYRAHEECKAAWAIVGPELDYYMPDAPYEWLEALEEELSVAKLDEGAETLRKAIARVNEAGWQTDKSA